MGVSVDTGGLDVLARDFRRSAAKLQAGMKPVVARSALETKKRMQDDLAASTHFKGITRSVSYDARAGVGWAEAVVGPDKGRGGALANIAYFGGSRGGGNTVRDPLDAAKEDIPAFEKALADLVGRTL